MLARLLRRWANQALTAQLDQVIRRNRQLLFFEQCLAYEMDKQDDMLAAYRAQLEKLASEVAQHRRCHTSGDVDTPHTGGQP